MHAFRGQKAAKPNMSTKESHAEAHMLHVHPDTLRVAAYVSTYAMIVAGVIATTASVDPDLVENSALIRAYGYVCAAPREVICPARPFLPRGVGCTFVTSNMFYGP